MRATLVSAPTGQLVSLAEAKAHLRVDHTADDGYIQALIFSAVSHAEDITRRKFLTQTWDVSFDDWPADYFPLPFGNLQSVTSVRYKDEEGVEYTVDAADYIVSDSEPGRVLLAYNSTWPTGTLYPSDPITIRIVCGYGDHALQTITNATNASPIVITSAAHGLVSGDRVLVSDVGGNTNANGSWQITKTTDDAFRLIGSTGNAAYTSGGQFVHVEVPEPIRFAVLMLVADAYQHRESVIVSASGVTTLPAVDNLLWPYRVWM